MAYNIAVIGATGIVGQTTLQVMKERGLDKHNIFLFASTKSEGKKINFQGKKLTVKKLDDSIFDLALDYALFCTDEIVSKDYVKKLALNGCKVVDYSSLYRKDFPLIVPEINFCQAKGNIICNPNCSTIAGVMALYNIHKRFGLSRIVYSTYQAVSGAGKEALKEISQTNQQKLKKFDYPIKNNIISYIGNINASGYCREEEKMIFETKKILNDWQIAVSAMTVRVPVDIGHSLAIFFETKQKTSVEEIRSVIEETEGVKYVSAPMPMFVRGQNDVFIGRLKQDEFNDRSFSIFVSSDNLRKGAGQNGVQILEKLIEKENDCL